MNIATQLSACLKAKQPGIQLRTLEEERAAEVIRQSVQPARKLLRWSACSGIWEMPKDAELPETPVVDGANLEVALKHFQQQGEPLVMALFDPWGELANAYMERLLRESLAHARLKGKTLILVGRDVKLPIEVADDIHILDLPLPSSGQLEEFIRSLCTIYSEKLAGKISIDEQSIPALARACQGLTLDETRSVVSFSLVMFKAISADAVTHALQHKKQIVRRSGILEYEEPFRTMGQVGGLKNLKTWIEKRAGLFSREARAAGIKAPRGVLLVGCPGTGKTLCARAIASAWKQPLLRLDAGKLFGSLVGESENNLRDALRTAEAVAPCVLMIDEIEKAFSTNTGAGDGGTSSRVFGALLSWMQDKTADVFVVATANYLDRLDAALVRRFDATFVVDLPDAASRCEILSIHTGATADAFEDVVAATQGFTGSEIETIVQEARINAFPSTKIASPDLLTVARQTVPLSKSMETQITALRDFCKSGRARHAGGTLEADAQKPTATIEI